MIKRYLKWEDAHLDQVFWTVLGFVIGWILGCIWVGSIIVNTTK